MERPESMSHSKQYCGRFAPSPTGPLHFGSIVAAAGSFLDARANGGKWLVRMEDIDEARTEADAISRIPYTLEALGMEWDGEITRQSRRKSIYGEALASLAGTTYPCSCSRRDTGEIYPGTCRNGARGAARTIRVRVGNETISFVDAIQGEFGQNLEKDVGDFVLFRADGFFAYQLAVVVDDMEQNVTHVVRGADLLDSTPRQVYLQRLLGHATPAYSHLPVAVNAKGEKLSKQTLAQAVEPGIPVLFNALKFLGQAPPDELLDADIASFWKWAIMHWDSADIPKTTTGSIDEFDQDRIPGP
ncbi:MAG: tRNA glutamyl-Q(34) synthetase GluQRS [Burkholderiales bacterium]|nr:tRNA glutamyl-Q(34) synthetase GluQRS [Burkholderiales bacterium]